MALPKTIEDREYRNFLECNGEPTKRVHVCQEAGETIKVEVVAGFGDGDSINIYNEVLALAGFATASILTYTVPVGKKFQLTRFDYSGENRAVYTVELNSDVIAKKRGYLVGYDGEFIFTSLLLAAGDIVTLKVENNSTTTANFNTNIQGRLLDA